MTREMREALEGLSFGARPGRAQAGFLPGETRLRDSRRVRVRRGLGVRH